MRRRLLIIALSTCFGGSMSSGLPLFTTPAWAGEVAVSAPAVQLALVFHAGIEPAAYWVSEKYDGVRAIWDGHELRFRSGRRVPAPDWFVAALPSEPLDGELWLGRGRFDELSAIVRKTSPLDYEWRRIQYMIFDQPGGAGTFDERLQHLQGLIDGRGTAWLRLIRQFRVADRDALTRELHAVVSGGGEGLMLHRADALYRSGRNDDLLKLKLRQDAEATVVGHEPGKGRLAGKLGALRLKTPEGREFRLGSGFSDEERAHPPAVGRTVTYRYQELTKQGIPRFPRYWRTHEEF